MHVRCYHVSKFPENQEWEHPQHPPKKKKEQKADNRHIIDLPWRSVLQLIEGVCFLAWSSYSFGPPLSMIQLHAGHGIRQDGCPNWEGWTLPEEPRFTSRPVPPLWLTRSCWARGTATAISTAFPIAPITSPTSWSGPSSSGSAGSASTAVRR